MKAVSLFSGVGGIDLAFERAGIETVLQAERDPWCNEVLARHWPQVERVNDVRLVRGDWRGLVVGESTGVEGSRGWGAEQLGVVYGGFPCQPFSVAGKRGGADDGRNGWPEFRRIVSELRPRWVVAENVPGLLSIDSGRYFASIVGDLDELGFAVAWAVLDAQHFGVPQRRRRVFIVAGPRGRGPEQVLSLCEGCGGNPETGGEAGEGVAATLGGGAGSRSWSPDTDRMTFIPDVSYSLTARAAMDRPESGSVTLIASTLRGRSHGEGVNMPGRGGEEAYGDNLIADTVRTHPRPGSNSLGSIAIRTAQTGSNGWGVGTDEQAYTLDGAQGQAVIHPALNVRDAKGPSSNADQAPPLVTSQGVRRLMPIECNRLQGFPDDWDRWTADGREIADSHRYRMMGNAVAVPVLEWIGRRLVAVDAL